MRKSITPLILSASDTAINRLSQKGRRKRARWSGDGRKK